jgi:hypothetical protein
MTIVFGWKQIGQHITGEVIRDQFEYSVSISDKWQNNSSWRRHHWMAIMDRIWVMLRLTAWRKMVQSGNRLAKILMAKWLVVIEEI